MEIFGKTELRTDEFADKLRFTITHENSLVETTITPVITVLVAWVFWRQNSPLTKFMAILVVLATAVAIVSNRRQGNEVSLEVNSDELVTQGNMGKLLETEQRIATKDVEGMSYRIGGEDESSGLYVKLRLSERCVLPRVSEEQAQQMIAAISKKFSDLPTSDALFSTFGTGDQITSLGLSANDEVQHERSRNSPDANKFSNS